MEAETGGMRLPAGKLRPVGNGHKREEHERRLPRALEEGVALPTPGLGTCSFLTARQQENRLLCLSAPHPPSPDLGAYNGDEEANPPSRMLHPPLPISSNWDLSVLLLG